MAVGQLRLLVTIGDAVHSTKAWMNFMIVRSLSPYNGIIGRPGIREIQAVPSTAYGMLKFPVDGGIVTIRSTILIPAKCATVITSSKETPKEAGVYHENFKVALHPNFPDHKVAIEGTLSKKRGQAPERAKAIQTEVQKLVEAEAEMLRDIDETFRTLHKINMKLNPKKCMFGVVEGMFLGYMISPEGIKSCPDKTDTVLQLPSPQTIKEVQSLNGKLASLNRFLSKSAEKSLPLFKTLKKYIKKSDFHWTPDAEQAFKQLK
ncbi:hypothetical protein Tco_0026990 [Tanacetum coccineum]